MANTVYQSSGQDVLTLMEISLDLYAAVLRLRPIEVVVLPNHMGRAIQQLFLTIIGRSNPHLAEELHAPGHLPKPYSISGLLNPRTNTAFIGRLTPEDEVCLRLVGLRRDVSTALAVSIQSLPPAVELDHQQWRVVGLDTTSSWAGEQTFAALIDDATRFLTRGLQFHFTLVAPTCFHSEGLEMALPLPKLVYGSLAQKWTASTGIAVSPDLPLFCTYFVVPDRFDVKTDTLILKQGKVWTGAVGKVTYRVDQANEQLDKQPELKSRLHTDRLSLTQLLSMLTVFAAWCGVGVKTTAGMGLAQTRITGNS